MSARILIVDDEPLQRELLELAVRRCGHIAETAAGGEAALARLETAPAVDLMLLDLVMPDLDGLGVLGRLRAKKLGVPVIALVSSGSIESALSATRAGAIDFVVKPAAAERLQLAVKNALRLTRLEDEIRSLGRRACGALTLKEAAVSPPMERVLRLGERAAKSALPVLLEGEPGVGKELIARAIHEASDRRGRPFVAVRCAALAGAEAERLLFGQAEGAGAAPGDKRLGKFLEAHSGALYLNEIDALPLAAQVRLLRAISDGEVAGVGARRPLKADVRLFASTGRNLIELVKTGRFREDLYYRLNVHPIAVPPLRQRRGEIEGLALAFCARFGTEEGRRLRGIGAEALNLLNAYDWPGNVRQLENAVFRAVILSEGDELTVAEFPQIAAEIDGFDVRIPPLPSRTAAALPYEPEAPRIEAQDPNFLALINESGDMRRLDELEAEAIRFALMHYRGRMSTMARKLGIGRSTLYRKMKDYDLPLAAATMEPDADGRAGESAA